MLLFLLIPHLNDLMTLTYTALEKEVKKQNCLPKNSLRQKSWAMAASQEWAL
jgi:hypothetical protein